HRPEVLAAVEKAMSSVDTRAYTQAARALGAGDLLSDAARVVVPALVAVGAQDLVTPPHNARRAQQAFSGACIYSEVEAAGQAFYSEDIVQISGPPLTDLAEGLHLSAHLAVLEGTEIVYLVRRAPNHPFASNIRVGSRLPAHASNMGRIILAHLPPERVDRMY